MTPYIFISVGGIIVVAVVAALLLYARKAASRPNGKHASVLASSLHDEKKKSEIILNSIGDGVILLDSEQTIQLFNPAAGRITGWEPKEATGIDHKLVIQLQNEKGEPYKENETPFARAFLEKQSITDREANLLTKQKTVKSVDITVTPLIDTDGQVSGATVVFRDVSEQRKEEAQRADFISTASHEMRTPVAAIEGYLALALNDNVSKIDDKARGFLNKAHESTKHLGKLFQDLLTSAKAEDGRLANHPRVVEMGQFLTELTDTFKFTAQSKGLSVEFVLGAEGSIIDASDTSTVKPLYYVHVDPDRIREVITNLFDNAVKYTDTGKVSIGLTGNDQIVQIRVQDTGVGIPPEDVPHLFQKFYRVDNSATRTIGGTGLGLFICRKIVELYHGRIWVESELGKGSTFYINLPRLSTMQATELQKQEAAQLPQIATSDIKL